MHTFFKKKLTCFQCVVPNVSRNTATCWCSNSLVQEWPLIGCLTFAQFYIYGLSSMGMFHECGLHSLIRGVGFLSWEGEPLLSSKLVLCIMTILSFKFVEALILILVQIVWESVFLLCLNVT